MMDNKMSSKYATRSFTEKVINKLMLGKLNDIQNDILQLNDTKIFFDEVLQRQSFEVDVLQQESVGVKTEIEDLKQKNTSLWMDFSKLLTSIEKKSGELAEIQKQNIEFANQIEKLGYSKKYVADILAYHDYQINQLLNECREKDNAIYILQKKIEYLTAGDESKNAKVVQVVQDLRYGDAVGNYVLETAKILRGKGIECEIYTRGIDERIIDEHVHLLGELPILNKKDILIIQVASEMWLLDLLDAFVCKTVMCYHNITPPELLDGHSEEAVISSKKGIEQLKKVASKIKYCIVDSDYNKNDLIKYGFDEACLKTIPLLIDFDQYKVCSDLKEKKEANERIWLTVGRIVPNKKIEDIIKIFIYYKNRYQSTDILVVAGRYDEKDRYYQELLSLANELYGRDIIFTGHISQERLNNYYSNADVYICMSEHEGFCVPLLESMYFQVPIVAYSSSAIPETLGGTGVLLKSKNQESAVASIWRVLNDNNYRANVIAKQNERLKAFECSKIQKQFYDYILKIMEEKDV